MSKFNANVSNGSGGKLMSQLTHLSSALGRCIAYIAIETLVGEEIR